MTLGKLLRVVQTGKLWFTNARLMEKHEGRLGAGDTELQEYLAAYGQEFTSLFHMNCWTEGPYESHAMWALYAGGGEGVSIRSSVGRFSEAVASESGEVLLGRIQYVDHATLKEPIQDGNILSPWLRKRAVLAAEREIRAGVIRPATDGLSVPVAVNLATLMDSVVVHPGAKPWFRDVVEATLRRASLSTPVVHSIIDEAPPRLRTMDELKALLEAKRKALRNGVGERGQAAAASDTPPTPPPSA